MAAATCKAGERRGRSWGYQVSERVRSGLLSSPNVKQADGSSQGCLLVLQLRWKGPAAERRGCGAGGDRSRLESAI